MEELIQKVLKWADDRNIIQGSSATKQLEKTAAELIELAIEIGKEEAIPGPLLPEEQSGRTASELGDVLVTLIIVAEQLGFSLDDCLQIAYDKIKGRHGRMVSGKFVKEEDL